MSGVKISELGILDSLSGNERIPVEGGGKNYSVTPDVILAHGVSAGVTQAAIVYKTSAAFVSENPVLGDGVVGHETDTRRQKTGDGVTSFVDLPYDVEVGCVNHISNSRFSNLDGWSSNSTTNLPSVEDVDGVSCVLVPAVPSPPKGQTAVPAGVFGGFLTDVGFAEGEAVVASVDVRSVDTKTKSIGLAVGDADALVTVSAQEGSWVRISKVFTVKAGIRVGIVSSSGYFYIKNYKVERGNIPTDWSPAPEDVESEIAGVKETAEAAYSRTVLSYSRDAYVLSDRSVLDIVPTEQVVTVSVDFAEDATTGTVAIHPTGSLTGVKAEFVLFGDRSYLFAIPDSVASMTCSANQALVYTLTKIGSLVTVDAVLSSIIVPDGGRKYVDLGLPSGTLWGYSNVGTSDSTRVGDYFAAGVATGRKDVGSNVDPKNQFRQDTYPWYGQNTGYTKYVTDPSVGIVDGLDTLQMSDDGARATFKGLWRVPSVADFQELCDNCVALRSASSVTNGVTFQSKINRNTIDMVWFGYIDGYQEKTGGIFYYLTTSLCNGMATVVNPRRSGAVYSDSPAVLTTQQMPVYYGMYIRPVLNLPTL